MPIEKRWVLKPQGDPQRTAQLAAATGIPKVLANLLVQRGIDTYESVSRFFNPKLSDLHDPFLMKDMDKAVRRIDEAVSRGEKIMVYGDYDVDGTTAVALVYIFLRQQGVKDMLFYIPDRYTEGYGISKLGVDYAKRQGGSISSSATTICPGRRSLPRWRCSTPSARTTPIPSTNCRDAASDSNWSRDTAR